MAKKIFLALVGAGLLAGCSSTSQTGGTGGKREVRKRGRTKRPGQAALLRVDKEEPGLPAAVHSTLLLAPPESKRPSGDCP